MAERCFSALLDLTVCMAIQPDHKGYCSLPSVIFDLTWFPIQMFRWGVKRHPHIDSMVLLFVYGFRVFNVDIDWEQFIISMAY